MTFSHDGLRDSLTHLAAPPYFYENLRRENDWASLASAIIRDNLKDTSILEISCDGFQISLITTAVAKIPFVLPFTGISEVRITSRVGIFDERKNP